MSLRRNKPVQGKTIIELAVDRACAKLALQNAENLADMAELEGMADINGREALLLASQSLAQLAAKFYPDYVKAAPETKGIIQ